MVPPPLASGDSGDVQAQHRYRRDHDDACGHINPFSNPGSDDDGYRSSTEIEVELLLPTQKAKTLAAGIEDALVGRVRDVGRCVEKHEIAAASMNRCNQDHPGFSPT